MRRMERKYLILALLAVGVLSLSAFSPTAKASSVSLNYTSVLADTWVNADLPNTVYGTDASMNMGYNNHQIPLIKFDISSIMGVNVTSAVLCVYNNYTIGPGTSYTMSVYNSTNTIWGENVYWNTPKPFAQAVVGTSNLTFRTAQWICPNVTEGVKNYIANGIRNATFELFSNIPTGGNYWDILYTREYASAYSEWLYVNYTGSPQNINMTFNPASTYVLNNFTYGTEVALANELDVIDSNCHDITIEVSEPHFGHLASGTDLQQAINQLGGASHFPTSYSFNLCGGQSFPFFVYLSPSTYGYPSTNPIGDITFSVRATSNNTVQAIKYYLINVTGTMIPIGLCNYNGICELGESNSFCPEDCPIEGQSGTVPCTGLNCTPSQDQTNTSNQIQNWWDTFNNSIPDIAKLLGSFIGVGAVSVVGSMKSKKWEIGAILAIVALIGFTAISWLNPIFGIVLIFAVGFILARSLFGK